MEQALFAEKLRELALKYAVAADMDVAFEPRAVLVSCELGNFRFYYDFAAAPEKDGRQNVPLMHWRLRRRYMELRNALEQGMVKVPLAMRVHHIVSTDDLTASLEDVLFMEADLFEWICGDEINRVFAAVDGDYMNGILSTAGNVKASMELGLLPGGSQPVLLHEVVTKTGVLSDVAVDTQTQQYPVYIFTGPETRVYTDLDYELYGLSQPECDAARYILWTLAKPERVKESCTRSARLNAVIAAAKAAAANTAYTSVEGGCPV